MHIKSHKDLEVWNKSIGFVTEIYKTTKSFPRDELYGLVSQLRRSSISIPSNIAEGAARCSDKEYVKFLYISLGSASEIDVQLLISKNLGYIDEGRYTALSGAREEISKMLSGLIKSLRNKKQPDH